MQKTMQKPITKTFEFFEYIHLIAKVYHSNKILIMLWLTGNKKMQYLMQQCLIKLNLNYKIKQKASMMWLLKKFKNIEYLKVDDIKFNVIKFIPIFIKVLDIGKYKIENLQIKNLPQTLTYLKANAEKLKNPNLPKNLTSLILFNCENFTIDFINNLSYKIINLSLTRLTFNKLELKHLINLVSLELKFGKIQTLILENCFDLKTLNLHGNNLVEFPQSILCFTSLESLNLLFNKLFQIPNSISQLQNLKYLNLSANKFIEFPTALLQLANLKTLDLNHNKIFKLLILNSKLQNLTDLNLSSNRINEIHLQLPELQFLHLSNNQIIQINLKTPNLEALGLVNNKYYLMLPKSTKIFTNWRTYYGCIIDYINYA